MAQEKCPNRQIAKHPYICIELGWRPTSFDHEIETSDFRGSAGWGNRVAKPRMNSETNAQSARHRTVGRCLTLPRSSWTAKDEADRYRVQEEPHATGLARKTAIACGIA